MSEWEPVAFGQIGAGGVAGELTLEQRISVQMNLLGRACLDPALDGEKGGSITVKIKVKRRAGNAVEYDPSLSVMEPPKIMQPLMAYSDDGEIVTQQHKQEPLPFELGKDPEPEAPIGGRVRHRFGEEKS